jgi:hypothetical protein
VQRLGGDQPLHGELREQLADGLTVVQSTALTSRRSQNSSKISVESASTLRATAGSISRRRSRASGCTVC